MASSDFFPHNNYYYYLCIISRIFDGLLEVIQLIRLSQVPYKSGTLLLIWQSINYCYFALFGELADHEVGLIELWII
jgi:hypothetical protein